MLLRYDIADAVTLMHYDADTPRCRRLLTRVDDIRWRV